MLLASFATLTAIVVAPTGVSVAAPALDPTPPTEKNLPLLTVEDLSPAERDLMKTQSPYMELDELVRQIAATSSRSPLAGTRLNVQKGALTVYWNGATPEELLGLRGHAAKQGIVLEIQSAPFSEVQLIDAARVLTALSESSELRMRIDVATEGTGLTVHYTGLPAAEADPSRAMPKQLELLAAIKSIEVHHGVPVDIADAAPMPQPLSREADYSPYWGGAQTWSAGARRCTSGFSMYATGAPTRFMSTVAHCTEFRDGVEIFSGNGARMGRTALIHQLFDFEPRYDLGAIQLDSGKTNSPIIYLDSGYVVVGGMASGIPAGGNYCVSGSSDGVAANCRLLSGAQAVYCGIQYRPTIPFGRCIYVIRWFTTVENQVVACFGDSGGPVYYWSGSRIIASGMISGGLDAGNCHTRGTMSVVSSAVNRSNINGLRLLTG